MSRLRHPLTAVVAAFVLTAPWVGVVLTGTTLDTGATVLTSGLAVLGASFLLAWGAETAEEDVPRAFALAVLAVLAVAPEYAVDALYAWSAGANGATPAACAQFTAEQLENAAEGTLADGCQSSNLAIANMTGANRILIGLGWSGVALFTILRSVRTDAEDEAVRDRPGTLADLVVLDKGISTEIAFLALATLWAFLVPLGGGIDALDTFVLVGLYVTYIVVVARAGAEAEEEHVGVPAYFQAYPRAKRIAVVLFLFAYSGAMILVAVEPFAHGLEELGVQFGIPEFFMIQWIAPLASESPELIVVTVLVLKARSTAGFNALISSKVNQWTLLIGTLAVVYSIALGRYGVLGFQFKQSLEIWLTAAQSYFALALLINFNISVREAIGLLVLFVSQVAVEFAILQILPGAIGLTNPETVSHQSLIAYTAVYMIVGTALFVRRREAVMEVAERVGATTREAMGRAPAGAGEGAD